MHSALPQSAATGGSVAGAAAALLCLHVVGDCRCVLGWAAPLREYSDRGDSECCVSHGSLFWFCLGSTLGTSILW